MSELEYRRISAEAMTDLRTVKKAYAGNLRAGLVHARITQAAERLSLPAPPPGVVKPR